MSSSSMSSQAAGPTKAISVQLIRSAVLPGEILEGEVHLQFPAILDNKYKEVHIKLHGSMDVTLTQKTDKFTNTKTGHSSELLKDKKAIWTRGTYPPPDSHVLKVPFQFALPNVLPPSCKHRAREYTNKQEITGEVSYHLEIVGARGALHSTRRERTPFRILPPSSRGTQLQQELAPEYTGAWRTVTRHVNVPVGRGKRTSRVEMQFKFPAIEAIPSSVHIPFTLRVVSMSPRISWDESSETEFIEPPTKPLDVDFRLERTLRIQPHGHQVPLATATNTILRLGGVGPGQVVRNGGPVTTEVSERYWVPELHDASYGSWKQEAVFSSRFRVVCPTTLVTELMRVEYRLYLRANLAVKSPILQCEIPITVIAGSVTPDTPSLEEASPVSDSPADSPPSYFDEFGELGRQRHNSGPTTLPTAFRESDRQLQEQWARMTVGSHNMAAVEANWL